MTSKFVDGLLEHVLDRQYPMTSEQLARLERSSGSIAAKPRFFVDTLTATGCLYLIPAARRAEWQAFDVRSEETAEMLPVPEWAKPVPELSDVEFESPTEIFK